MNILVLMAGAGSRLKTKENKVPKPLVPINGAPMIEHVVRNLNLTGNYIYIVQKSHRKKWNLDRLLNDITPGCKLVEVDGLTDGQASSALLGKDHINNNEKLLTINCDQILDWNSQAFLDNISDEWVDGCIPAIKTDNPSMSFAKLNSKGLVEKTAEKQVISEWGTVGYYYWRKGCNFVKYAEQMLDSNIRVNNEFYICPVYNLAIQDGLKITVQEVNKMWALGTPDELDLYLKTL